MIRDTFRQSACLVLLSLVIGPAGCGDPGAGSGREPDVPTAGGDRVAPTASGLPAGHPPIGSSPSAGDADAVRTGPFQREFEGIGVTVSVPDGWRELKQSPRDAMFNILARLVIPVDGQDLQLSLSDIGGGIEANIDRWKHQVAAAGDEDAIIESIEVDSREATWVALRGRYTPPPFQQSETPQDDWTILGAAIPLEGEHAFYVKLLGPSEAVAQVREEFRTFVESARVR